MIKINGVEYGLFWSIWAHCAFDNWLVKNRSLSYTASIIRKAVIANEAYRKTEAGKNSPELTEAMINKLPNKEYADIAAAVEKQIAEDSGITIDLEESGKNAESSGESV